MVPIRVCFGDSNARTLDSNSFGIHKFKMKSPQCIMLK